MTISNIKPVTVPTPTPPVVIRDPDKIAAALRESGCDVGPDPHHDGEWATVVQYTDPSGDHGIPETLHIIGFSDRVGAVPERGLMGISRTVTIIDGKLHLD